MNFISIASTRYQADIHLRVVEELRKSITDVQFFCISTDLWYAGEATSNFVRNGAKVTELIRPSGEVSSWWTTKNIGAEVFKYAKEIKDQVETLIAEINPSIFFIDDDSGPLEVLIINCFKINNIPIVLFEHGYNFALTKLSSILQKIGLKDCLKMKVKKIFQIIKNKNSIIDVNSFGENNEDKILCLSEWTRSIHEESGINSEKLIVTGNPYYDMIVEKRSKKRAIDAQEKILICSTGEAKFGMYSEYNYLILIIKDICLKNPTLSFELRLKFSEKLETSDELTCSLINMENFSLADNSQPFCEIAKMYDAIISQKSSLIALESIIIGVPVLLYGERNEIQDDSETPNKLLFSIYERIGLKHIEHTSPGSFIRDQILSSKKNEREFENLLDELTPYFGPMDGCCSARVADEVIKTLALYK